MPAAMQANGLAPLEPARRTVEVDAFLLVIGVQDENAPHGPGHHRTDHIILARRGEHHVQEVLGIAQVVARIDKGLAQGKLIGHRRDGRHLGDQTVRRDHAVLGIRNIGAVMVEGRKRADHAAHDCHGMGIPAKSPEEVCELLVQHGVVGDVFLVFVLLVLGGQLSVQKQVADFHVFGVFRQFLDGITAVKKNPLVAVNESDLGFAASRRGVSRVISEATGIPVETPHVDDLRTLGPGEHRQFDALPG